MFDLNLPVAILPSFGWQEGLVILAIVMLIFGPKKLPEVAEAMGKSIRKFKNASREMEDGIKNELKSDPPRRPIDEGDKTE
jgi:TatA/E family protein of Tat protein translocase